MLKNMLKDIIPNLISFQNIFEKTENLNEEIKNELIKTEIIDVKFKTY